MHDLLAKATPMSGSLSRVSIKTTPNLVKEEIKNYRWLKDQDNPDAQILERKDQNPPRAATGCVQSHGP